jgi:putative molybdopterin biosynthesis protein
VTRFLTLTPYKRALELLQESTRFPYQSEQVQVTKSLGRVTCQAVYAKRTVPQTAISQRDGYAVSSADTEEARDSQPIMLRDYAFVHSGSPIPQGYDAVIMQEDVRVEPDRIFALKPARSCQNIQKAGAETSFGKMIVPADHCISAADVGAMVSYGITMVEIKKFIVTLIPVGDELKKSCTILGPGEVIESNTLMLQSYLEKLNITPILHSIIPDSPEKLQDAIQQAVLNSSFVIISGGTSTGRRDYTKSVLSEIGAVLYHGIAMRPGRTTLAARVDDVMVFGLPGTPAGTIAVFEEVILPWLFACGFPIPMHHIVQAMLAESIPSDIGTDDFIPMVVGAVNGTYRAVMVPRGNGQMTHVRANGILHIPHNVEGLKQGDRCNIRLIRSYSEPDNVLLVVGVSDLIIDILDQFLRKDQMRLYCRPAKTDAVLLSMQNNGIHGGIISRFHMNDFCDTDYSLLSASSSAIRIADRVYIMAYREEDDSREQQAIVQYDASICVHEGEIAQKIRTGEIVAGPCSEHLAAEYNLSGPVIGHESIDLIIRNEDMESEYVKHVQRLLSSEAWKKEVNLVTGYSAEKSGEIFPLLN